MGFSDDFFSLGAHIWYSFSRKKSLVVNYINKARYTYLSTSVQSNSKISLCLLVTFSFKANNITGTTPPHVTCPNKLCHSKMDGNFIYNDPHTGDERSNYFVQCSNGKASCQPCFPLSLEFSEKCNQCLPKKTGWYFWFREDFLQ